MTVPFWTLSGTIDLLDIQPENLTAEIVASALAKLNRFTGRTDEPLPVATHSVLVERLCPPDLGPWALLHDAHEIFIGDITQPAVDLIARVGRQPHVPAAINAAKARLDRTIAHAWGTVSRSMSHQLRRADRIALQAEAILFLHIKPVLIEHDDEEEIDRAIDILRGLPVGSDWRVARDLWLERVEHYSHLGVMAPPKATIPA